MTEKEYVVLACRSCGVDLFAPTNKSPEILGMKDGRVVIEATKWAEAKKQIDLHRLR